MTRTLRHLFAGTVVVVAAATAATGCGDSSAGDSGSSSDSASGTRTTAPRTVETGSKAKDVRFTLTPALIPVSEWKSGTNNSTTISGMAMAGSAGVSGAHVLLDRWQSPDTTGDDGSFTLPIDYTLPDRRLVRLADTKGGDHDGATTYLNIAFPMQLQRGTQEGASGTTITGSARFAGAGGRPVPPVVLFAYQLDGTVTDADGEPVEGAVVSAKDPNEGVWNLSPPTDSKGRYRLDFLPGTTSEGLSIRVAIDDDTFETGEKGLTKFAALKSSTLDLRINRDTDGLELGTPKAEPGAVYEGLLVGAINGDGEVVQPTAATWPDAQGHFTVTYADGAVDDDATYFQRFGYVFQRSAATPGGAVDLAGWPTKLEDDVPRDLPLTGGFGGAASGA